MRNSERYSQPPASIQLTADQTDAVRELVNIAFGRAAAALSELTGYRIHLEVPTVIVCPVAHLGPRLRKTLGEKVACVTQSFSGAIAGTALLLLDQEAAVGLSQLLDDEVKGQLDAYAREVLTEAGNVLLNACLGTFGNLLEVQIGFSVPKMDVESVSAMLRSTTIQGDDLAQALLLQTSFRLRANGVSGYVMFVLGFTSLQRLVSALDEWDRA